MLRYYFIIAKKRKESKKLLDKFIELKSKMEENLIKNGRMTIEKISSAIHRCQKCYNTSIFQLSKLIYKS